VTRLAETLAEPESNGDVREDIRSLVGEVVVKRGAIEVRPGQSAQLALLRRVAPDFINRQLWKAARPLVPLG
jgi:arginine utilization protein RocB